jgi:uncharacterized membrane protein
MMPTPLIIAVQWLHVLLGIFWFGSTLYVDVILVPTLMGLPLAKQQEVTGRLAQRSSQILLPVAALVVALGFLRGTVFGQLHSVADVFGGAYGLTWLVALLTGVALLGWSFTCSSGRSTGSTSPRGRSSLPPDSSAPRGSRWRSWPSSR